MQICDVPKEIETLGRALAPLSKHITYMRAWRSISDKDQSLVSGIRDFQEQRVNALSSEELAALVKGCLKNYIEPGEWLKLMSRIDTKGETPLNLSKLTEYRKAIQPLSKVSTLRVYQLLDAIQEKMDRRLTITEIQKYEPPFSKLSNVVSEHPWQSFELLTAIQAKAGAPLSGGDIMSLADALRGIRF